MASVCLEPGCPGLAQLRGRCDNHARERSNELRNPFYSTKTWMTTRDAVLLRDRRICRLCGRWAEEVDHIKGMTEGGAAMDMKNLQAICSRCHRRKTNREIRDRQW